MLGNSQEIAMAKRKSSERTQFERWYCEAFGLTLAELRGWRAENGYGWREIDWAWIGWSARARSQGNSP